MSAYTQDDEEVPPEFECSICMKLLLDPVSVSCGHTFCRACLEQSLGYRGLCAVCRAPVAGVQAVNVLIRGIIAERFPRALAHRRQELEEELRTSEQQADLERRQEVHGAGSPGTPMILPLARDFKALSLPHCRDELELQSPVEVQLVEYALQGSRRIGVIDGPAGSYDDSARDFGVCLEIEHLERPPGQPPRARLVGKFRFWVVEPPQLHEAGFELGRCEAFFDEPLPIVELSLSPEGVQAQAPAPEHQLGEERVPPGEGMQEAGGDIGNDGVAGEHVHAPTALEIARRALELIEYQLVIIGHGGRHEFSMRFGDMPILRSATAATTTSASLEHISFWLLGAIVSDDAHRRRWLASVDTRGRLEACCSLLELAGSRPVLELSGARSWMNPGQSAFSSIALLIVILALLIAKAMGLFEKRPHYQHHYDGDQSSMNDMWHWAQLLR